jgi:glucose/arabinose dehydrogenase/endonuclease YncB( thermonuclease family)
MKVRMRTRLRLLIILVFLVLLVRLEPMPVRAQRVEPGGAPPAGSGAVEASGFIRVIDGDTIETWIDGKRVGIGLIGTSAPMGNTDCGRVAAALLRTLVTGAGGIGRGPLRLDEDLAFTFDARGRRMYYASNRDGRSIAEELVRAGVARAEGSGRERNRLGELESEARAAGRGCLWGGQQGAGASDTASMATHPATQDVPPERPDDTAPDDSVFMAMRPGGELLLAAPLATTLPSGFVEDVIATGLTNPTAFTFLPDGRILIAQQNGVVRVHKNGALLPTPFIDVQDRVNDYWDRGLLGIAADPNFATNGHVYLLYTYENDLAQYSGTKTARLTRVTASTPTVDTASPSSEVVILGRTVGSSCNNFPAGTDCLPGDSPSHQVGNLKFAPDGSLFVTTGDAAHFNYVDDNALRTQKLDLLSGKVLRITTSGAGVSGNPFMTSDPNANRSKVWAWGVRNAFRFNLRSGDSLPYIGDVGWNGWEEINTVPAGANLGWPCYEGGARQAGYEPKSDCQALYGQGASAVRSPLVAWDHSAGSAAATGGAFYTGTTYPTQYQGAYFYGDYSRGWIRYLRVDAGNNLVGGPTDFATGAGGPVDIEMGPDQSLYYLAFGGQLRRIRYATAPPATCPTGQYRAEYFDNRTLTGTPTFSRCETGINYSWDSGGPGNGVGPDDFSVRWTGRFGFAAGDHTFVATADDGVRLWLDGASLIDAWRDQPPTEYRATRSVTAGEHEVKVEYYEANYGAIAQVGWQGPPTTNSPPTATISAPSPTLRFKVGDAVTYSGAATDPEDGTIPASGLAWQVIIHHCSGSSCHTHPFTSSSGTSSGSFTAPDHEEDFHLEIVLSATDSQGLDDTASVTIQPQTVQVTLDTSPGGLQVVYNGQGGTAPMTRNPIIGGSRTISAPSPQGNSTFASWSDGGAQQHNVTVPATNASYTAAFTTVADTTPPTVSTVAPAEGATGVTVTANVTATLSEPMDPATLTTSTVTLAQGATTVPAAVSYDGPSRTVTLDPSASLAAGTAYTATVKGGANGAKDVAGNPLAADKVWSFTTATTLTACPTGQYLAQYYSDRTLSGSPAVTRCEPSINYDWSTGSPASGVGPDNFSVRWTGRHSFAASNYTFAATADDGIRVWVDGTLLIDAWVDQPPTTYQNTRGLAAGEHEVKVEYYENGGGASAQLSWQATGGGTACPTGQYAAQFYNNRTLSGSPTFTRCEAGIDYDWGSGGPGNGVGNDNFSVRWTGRFNFAAGSHTFIATADDGIRVWLDGTPIINAWRDQPPTEYRATRTLTAGEHEVKVEYYENGFGAIARVRW